MLVHLERRVRKLNFECLDLYLTIGFPLQTKIRKVIFVKELRVIVKQSSSKIVVNDTNPYIYLHIISPSELISSVLEEGK